MKFNASNAYGVLLPPECSIYFYSHHRIIPTEKKLKVPEDGKINFNKELANYEIRFEGEVVIPTESIESFKVMFDELYVKWRDMKKKIEEKKVMEK